MVEKGFDVGGGLGEVLGVDDFVALNIVALNGLFTNHALSWIVDDVFTFLLSFNFIAVPNFVVAHGLLLVVAVVNGD